MTERLIEARLRTALHARADLVTVQQLRPAEPPVVPTWIVRRQRVTALVLGAAAVLLCVVVLSRGGQREAPVAPAVRPAGSSHTRSGESVPAPAPPVGQARPAARAGVVTPSVSTSPPMPRLPRPRPPMPGGHAPSHDPLPSQDPGRTPRPPASRAGHPSPSPA